MNKRLLSILSVIAALTLYLAIIWLYITQSYQHQPLQTGHLASGQTFFGEDYSKSLDLRIAAKAGYPSSAINKVKAVNSSSNVKEQIISFQVPTDNLTEYGLMMLPNSPKPVGGYPTIILCHGYYNPEQYNTTTGYLSDMNFYAQHGFAVIKPDYRGQGLSIHQGIPEGSYYSMAYNTDVMSLISAVQQTSYLDKNNINLWGHSMGAYIALRVAVLSPTIKNLILLSGPVGYPRDLFRDYTASSDQDNPVALNIRSTVLLKYGTPLSNPNFWNNTAPINFLNKLGAKVQINVGSADQRVPPKFSAELDQALNKAGKAHGYYLYPAGSHSLLAQRVAIWQVSLQILRTSSN